MQDREGLEKPTNPDSTICGNTSSESRLEGAFESSDKDAAFV